MPHYSERGLNPDFARGMPKQGATAFDVSTPGREGIIVRDPTVPRFSLPPAELLRDQEVVLPQLSEPEVVRHYTRLSQQNYSIGTGDGYPLGSCTMKYNPRRHEEITAIAEFAQAHPEQPMETIQGTLFVMHELQTFLSKITGMHAATIAPMGGAHGELTGVTIISAYHKKNGEGDRRRIMLVPDSAHGTNPASATMAGYEVVEVKSGKDGNVDMNDFRSKMNERVAGMMITQPNTLGLFDTNIFQVAGELHENGALLYGDGANMNALLLIARPGDMGIDVMHINTHKALTTPHGGGGPGAGPVMVTEELADFLPTPIVEKNLETGNYQFATPKYSIGRISGGPGNVAVLLRAYSYIRTMGEEGLRQVSENAVLNANYLRALLKGVYPMQYGNDRSAIMHELVVQGTPFKSSLLQKPTIDIAKRMIDYGFHPPTVYFPLIESDAMMIEPTETESREGIKRLADAMLAIAEEARKNPELLHEAPHFTPVRRLDETEAARHPKLRWRPSA